MRDDQDDSVQCSLQSEDGQNTIFPFSQYADFCNMHQENREVDYNTDDNQDDQRCSLVIQDDLNNQSIIENNSILASSGYSTDNSVLIDVDHEEETVVQPKLIQVIVPSSMKAKLKFPTVFTPRKYHVPSLIYHGDSFSEDILKKMYSCILKKYYTNSPIFTAKVTDSTNRIGKIRPIFSDRLVTGSSENMEKFIRDSSTKIDQNGQLFLSILVTFPTNNFETIASYLVTKNFVVTQNFRGNEEDLFERNYEVHDHMANLGCRQNCNKKPLAQFLEENPGLLTNWNDIVPTYVCDSVRKIRELITNIVNCPTYSLRAEEYCFTLTYKETGEIQLVGIIWPRMFMKVNEMLANVSYGLPWKEDIVEDLLQKLEVDIATRTDAAYFQQILAIPDLIAHRAADLTNRTQVHFEKCSFCTPLQLPSPVSFVTKPYPTFSNIYSCKRLKLWMEKFVATLSIQEKEELSVTEFLNRTLINEVNVEEVDQDQSVNVIISNETLRFDLDDDLNRLIAEFPNSQITPIYLYSIMFSDIQEIYLKKSLIKEVFTHPYSWVFLEAAGTTIEVCPRIGKDQWQSYYHRVRSDIQCNIESHRTLSLAEVIATLDGRRFKLPESQVICIVKPLPSLIFSAVKVSQQSDISFTDEASDSQFEEVVSSKKKFLNRLNALFITLSEFLIWYDNMREGEIEIFSAYKQKLENIPESNETNLDSTHFLPQYILISNGSVVELRKKKKVLLVHNKSEITASEEKYCKYLLYNKYLKSDDFSQEDVNTVINTHDCYVETVPCNILDSNKKALFPYKLKSVI